MRETFDALTDQKIELVRTNIQNVHLHLSGITTVNPVEELGSPSSSSHLPVKFRNNVD